MSYISTPLARSPARFPPPQVGVSQGACTWIFDTHTAAEGIYRAAAGGYPTKIVYQTYSPPPAGRQQPGPERRHTLPIICEPASVLSPTAHGLLCASDPEGEELPQLQNAARENTRSTRTHRGTGKHSRPQATQYIQDDTTPGEQKNPRHRSTRI